MEEITKEWPAKFLVPVEHIKLSDPDLIGSFVVTCEEYDAPSSSRKKKEGRCTGTEKHIRGDCIRFT
jgi:hypothetical protein